MKKGSVTVYLCLTLCVITALIFTAIDSARLSCGRAFVSLAAEEGLFSLFGEYDRLLYEQYGLLMIDGGYGERDLKAGELLKEAAAVMKKVLDQKAFGTGGSSANLFHADIDSEAVTGYVLATDTGGEPLRRQIHDLMLLKIGADAVSALYEAFAGNASLIESAENSTEDRMDRLRAEYEARKVEKTEEESAPSGESEEKPAADTETAMKAENSISNIYKLRKLGILAIAIPDLDLNAISGTQFDKQAFPSVRALAGGMGVLPEEKASVEDRFLLARYITDFFPSFTDTDTKTSFRYQAEYVIAGKNRDVDNLKAVLDRMTAIREVLNFLYLSVDPEKRAQVETVALAVSSVLAMPEITEMVATILMLCWAYGESVLDIKTLLAGGKVPLMKDKTTWHLELTELVELSAYTAPVQSDRGLDYDEYLVALLMMKGNEKLLSGICDLLEYNRRIAGNEPEFSIDTCVCGMEIEIEGCIGSHDYTLTRRYGYDGA